MRNQVRRVFLVGVCAIAPLSLTMMVQSSGGATEPDGQQSPSADSDPSLVTAQPADAEPAAARPDQRFGNLTVTFGRYDAPDLPDEMAGLAGAAAQLADDNAEDIAGSWYDPTTRSIAIAPNSLRGRTLAQEFAAEHDNVEVSPSMLSHVELKELGRTLVDKVPVLRQMTQVLGVDPQRGGVYLEVAAELPDLQPVITAVSVLPIPVELRVTGLVPLEDQPLFDDNRRSDETPFSGGFGYKTGNGGQATGGYCSGAFGYTEGDTDFSLTAGHCFVVGTPDNQMFTMNGAWLNTNDELQYAGLFTGRTSMQSLTAGSRRVPTDDQFHGDVALVNNQTVGRASGNNMWDGGPGTVSKSPVTSRIAPSLGLNVCIGGATSGSVCTAEVTAVNADININGSGVWLRDADLAHGDTHANCSDGGDSGGSIFRRSVGEIVAVGVISGHTNYGGGGCQQRFTGAEEAIQAWGGGVKGAL
jgi:hypothetical protein